MWTDPHTNDYSQKNLPHSYCNIAVCWSFCFLSKDASIVQGFHTKDGQGEAELDKNHLVTKCDAIWETVHKVGKCDFEIFMTYHRGENEKYTEKKILKSSILHQGIMFQRSKLQKASSKKKMFQVFLSWLVENNFFRLL